MSQNQQNIICHFKWKARNSFHKLSEQIKCTNIDVDPSLVHLQGVKGHPTNKLTTSLETQKDLEG